MAKERELIKGEEKLWADIRGYQVATSSARILGELEELTIDEKTGKITDIIIKTDSERNVNVKGAKRNGDLLIVPFGKVEKVGEFIIISG
ncbi:PRC-barrel domain-containing protein [Candidatus Methanosphaera massiliense]|jgi:sporulation protein YlmC with PRC-barrel domain|uniref:PRC-barrel domain-containing protein n=1 Tax=Methanosphaera TaxID=2316 RepID=UPI000DC55DEB|nr:PRC-barrel domain-containing protein [Candidatus Methanosphaera massiliense]MDD6285255.1 PRC-barrel domain-containing protein [Methanobacteriaceae archaeon]MDE4078273.1 PRC-barrel domain-containing protein [Candidatus Methanosphaera massiliense]MDY2745227.1 PRC-barrel domain-containing protein [Methanosphaera sp.]RAP44454.1 MAG: photosystem reaction center subunit H [Methanosphaera sp. SHI1033]